MECSKCGFINNSGAKFCIKCGNPLKIKKIKKKPEISEAQKQEKKEKARKRTSKTFLYIIIIAVIIVSGRHIQKTLKIKQLEKERIALENEQKEKAESEFNKILSDNDLVLVEGDRFLMGSDTGDDDEKPLHVVELEDYYIGKYEITNNQYCEYLNDKKPSSQYLYEFIDIEDENCPIVKDGGIFKPKSGLGNHPVTNIPKYSGCIGYCTWLMNKTKLPLRFSLPTEAQWEFAARGADYFIDYEYAGSDNIDDVAWYADNSNEEIHSVGRKKPNTLGLYDMSGNVWEWCYDYYKEDYYANSPGLSPRGASSGEEYVVRGGSCTSEDSHCRIANRSSFKDPYKLIGFRIVMVREQNSIE